MPTGSVQDDRRTRRRFVLLWSGAVVVAFAVFVAGGQTLGRDTHDPAPTIDADGTGTALVLDAPPVDIDPDPNGVPAAVAGDPGTLQVQP